MEGTVFGVSLVASFLAGALALFAPCCITFLLPSYFGTIFQKQRKVMYYTLIFALGLSSVFVPIALGFRFFILLFDEFHQQIYYLGGLLLIFMGIMTLKPFFHLPMVFRFQNNLQKKLSVPSVFVLGVTSGLTSSCCTPVLFAAVTLTSLSPNLFQALIVSLAYILGIIFPLFVISLLSQRVTKKIGGNNRQKIYKILQIIGSIIFILSGLLIILMTVTNKIEMYQREGYSANIRLMVVAVAKRFQNPIVDISLFIFILFVFYQLLRKTNGKKE